MLNSHLMFIGGPRVRSSEKLNVFHILLFPALGRSPGALRPLFFWTAVLLCLNFSWRVVRYGLAFPVWGDEAFVAVNLLTRTFPQLAQPLDHSQIVPLLFLWSEWSVAKIMGYGEHALRLIPFLAGIGSLYLFYNLAFRMLGGHRALASLAIFAASFYPVRHAAEIKPYSSDLLIALILLSIGWRLNEDPERRGHWLALALTSAVGVWASYPAVFVGGGIVLVFTLKALLANSRKVLFYVLLTGLALLLSFSAMYIVFGRGQAEAGTYLVTMKTWNFAFPPVTEPWTLPIWFVKVHTGNMFAYPNGGHNGGSTATFLLFLAGIIALWRRHRTTVLLLLSPLPLMFIAAAFYKYPYGGSARVALHVAPMVCLLAGSGLVALLMKYFKTTMALRTLHSTYAICSLVIVIAILRRLCAPVQKRSGLA